MKVCKVVINSVSHDARVLKEAEAVREAGFDVVILGIQDANNNIPIQLLENGVVIRRAAWQSAAFRPSPLFYFIQAIALLIVVSAALFGIIWLTENYSSVLLWLTFENAVILFGFLLLIYFGWMLWNHYQRRRKNYLNLKKREQDGLLKYETDFSAYQRLMATVSTQAVAVLSKSTSPISESTRPSWLGKKLRRLSRQMPRPLMGGLLRMLDPSNVRRWRVVFAREQQIYKLLEEHAPDIVHAHDLSALPLAVKYAKAYGVKLVFDAHEIYDHLAQSEDELSELNSKLLNKYSGDVDLFITINDSISRYYRSAYPYLPKAVVIKNATKLVEQFTYDGRLHEVAGLPRKTRILIYQGGFAPKRGLIQLLLSAEYLNADWSLVFMGWGKLEEELRRVSDSLKMKNSDLDLRIRFVPKVKQTELPYWTAGATLGAIPYENTGLNHWYCNPNKLWEYPNAGVPIIASPFPELRKIIEDNQIGWLLPDPLSPREIAAAINKLTEEELAVAAKNCNIFIQRDNWQVYANRLKTAYAGLK
jgi:glycosyltransferase involved in cell wall biosynthesis